MGLDIVLEPDEVEIDTSPVSYFPGGSQKYKGNLTVTNRRLIYQGILSASSAHDGRLEIDRRKIKRVEINHSGLTRLCTVWLKDGSRHAFDYGEKNIDELTAELEGTRSTRARKKPASLARRLIVTTVCVILAVIASDIAGVMVCWYVHFTRESLASRMFDYALWIVLGFFTGFFVHYLAGFYASPDSAGIWTNRAGAATTGRFVCGVMIPVLIALALASLLWDGSSDSSYVPGNHALSIAYFAAIAAGLALAQYILSDSSKVKA